MEKKSRLKKSVKNIFYAISSQIVSLAFGFVARAVFLVYLNETYLGVNTLFTEVLSMLSIADLGLNSIVLFSFFDPLAKNDNKMLAALVKFYKQIYHGIALVIALMGIALLPFLKYIINLEQGIEHIYLYYLIFLANTVVSYLFTYKAILLNADQRNYYISKIAMYTRISCTGFQIISMVLTRSYLIYVLLEVLYTFIQNLMVSRKADKLFPCIHIAEGVELEKSEKKIIYRNIKDGFIYKISGVLLNGTDNTLISIMISIVAVARFNNYSMITTRIVIICGLLFSSMTGSVGNLIATETKEKRAHIFSIMQTISNILSAVIITCVFLLISDLVRVWIGTQYVIDVNVVIALMMNVYFSIALQPMWAFRDATGMFRKIKYVMFACAVINIGLSVLLGHYWGIAGIIMASAISRLVTYFWYEPVILYKEFFGKRSSEYFFIHFYNVIVIVAVTLAMYRPLKHWHVSSWPELFGKACAVGLGTIAIYLFVYGWRNDFKNAYQYLKNR